MPAIKSFRQGSGQQRHHKHRLGRMLVPHGRVAGVLFTVNPRQEGKALRELQLYLHPLIADLEKAAKEQEDEMKKTTEEEEEEEEEEENVERLKEEKTVASTSSLLAAELAAYHVVKRDARQEKNNNEDNNNNDDDASSTSSSPSSPTRKRQRMDENNKRKVVKNTQRWLAPLETGCKGHLMISIPFPLKKFTEEENEIRIITENNNNNEGCSVSGEVDSHSQRENDIPHTIIYNPLVQIVVERIFKDMKENPRPVLRNSFRLMPCEITCCPTLPEMRIALERLILVHFPNKIEEDRPKLHRISFSFKVKNNTNVDNKRAYLQAALETVFPANRFVVIPSARIKSCEGGVEAMFCAVVAHATCVMGVQRDFSERGEYNLHAIGAKCLELSSSV